MSQYYHAGAMDENNDVLWSDHTRRSAAAAEREALEMARKTGRRAIVETWDRLHGLRPGDANAVNDAYMVESV